MDLRDLKWRKSTRSLNNGGECVELANVSGVVGVRDSKDPNGPVLLVAPAVLRSAVRAARPAA